ncbi:MAG: lysostaphin resistance A-like protein [Candidatus Odinarchaeota archaeon]
MMFEEKKENLQNFIIPTILATLFVLLQKSLELVIAIILYLLSLIDDIVTAKSLILLTSQVFGAVVVYFVIIPLFRVKDEKYRTMNQVSSYYSLTIFCLLFSFIMLSTIGFSAVASILDVNVYTSQVTVPLTGAQVDHPLFNVIFWLGALTIGAAVFNELFYRRTLIPLLEERGMSPFVSVIASSLAFGSIHCLDGLWYRADYWRSGLIGDLFSIQLKYDLLTTLFYALEQFWLAFLVGMACGVAYIVTRNVAFSVFIHSLGNLAIISPYFFKLMDNGLLTGILGLVTVIINIVGLGIAVLALWKYSQSPPDCEWVEIIKEKSSLSLKKRGIGYLALFLVLVLIFLYLPPSTYRPEGEINIILMIVVTRIGVFSWFIWFLKSKIAPKPDGILDKNSGVDVN